jgi:AraC-like DNA-binding protein
MSQIRQIEDDGFVVRSLAVRYGDQHRLPSHTHIWGQLIYAASGVMQVSTKSITWIVPPMRAIWIPAQTSHAIEVREVTAMRTLYIAPAQAASLSRSCLAIEVSPLLTELILHIVARGMLGAVKSQDSHLTALLLDLIACSEATPLGLPLPNDRRARRLAERIIDDPENVLPLVDLAGESGASLRTLQRLFAAETGMSIEAWRARARLRQGLVLLTSGASVTDTALRIGYSSPSAFISAFRRYFATTPARYRINRAGA